LGHAYQQAGKYEQAIYHHAQELRLSILHHTKSNHSKDMAAALKKKRANASSSSTSTIGDADDEKDGVDVDEELKVSTEQVNIDCCKAYRFLGIAYSSAGRLKHALEAHEKSRNIAVVLRNLVEQQRTNHNYGEAAQALYLSLPSNRKDESLLDRAHEALTEAVRLSDKIARDKTGHLLDAAAGVCLLLFSSP
jgi:tetratricopeptide (TPR) repeat protein